MSESIDKPTDPVVSLESINSTAGLESKTAAPKANSESKQHSQITSGFSPKDIVLAKVKGYPPWPAMVLDEEIVPPHIQAKKPKTMVIPSKKKNAKPIVILPVRFFSDDTYIWIKSSDIKELSDEMIDDFLSKSKRRKDNLLESAYNLAKNPLDMELFAKYGSTGKPPKIPVVVEESEVEEEDEEELDESVEEFTPVKKAKVTKSKKTTAKSTKKAPAKPKGRSKSAKASKAKDPVLDDPDWGLDVDINENYKAGNFIYESKEEQKRFDQEFPRSEVLSQKLGDVSKEFNRLSNQVIEQLIDLKEDDDINPKPVVDQLTKLLKLQIPVLVISKSRLLKVLILTNRNGYNETLCKKINKLLKQWVGYEIEVNPEVKEETVEPETADATAEPETVESTVEPETNGVKQENGHVE